MRKYSARPRGFAAFYLWNLAQHKNILYNDWILAINCSILFLVHSTLAIYFNSWHTQACDLVEPIPKIKYIYSIFLYWMFLRSQQCIVYWYRWEIFTKSQACTALDDSFRSFSVHCTYITCPTSDTVYLRFLSNEPHVLPIYGKVLRS